MLCITHKLICMKKLLTFLSIVALLTGAGCKDKPSKEPQKPIKTAITENKIAKSTSAADTLKIKPVVQNEEPPKPADKYFLIAGSFADRNNAEEFKTELVADGYQSLVLERPQGPNGEFYKVSYKSFYDRNEAYSELRTARNSEGRSNVWLLVKK